MTKSSYKKAIRGIVGEIKKRRLPFEWATSASISCRIVLFCGVNSLRRTCISAGTALGAHFGVDRILVTFRDCANGAFIDTSAASDTIVTNYVSHCVKFLMISTNYGGQK